MNDPTTAPLTPAPPTREQITALEQANDVRLNALQAQGVQIEPASLMGVRVQHLIDMLFGVGEERGRLMFDMTLAQRYATELDAAEAQVRRQALAAGTGPQGLIIPAGVARRPRPVRDAPQG